MRSLIVYESIFGRTRDIAEAIARGIGTTTDVQLLQAADALGADLTGVDLLVVGAPTHAHGMPRPLTRIAVPDYIAAARTPLVAEPGAVEGPGVREWLSMLGHLHAMGAAFDTRVPGPAAFTGRASTHIAKSLERHGLYLPVPKGSFLVDPHGDLLAGELERATTWGTQVANSLLSAASPLTQ